MRHFLLSGRRVLRVIWMACSACGEEQALGDRNGLDDAFLDAPVRTADLGVPGRDLFPGQCPELAAQAGLVAFDG